MKRLYIYKGIAGALTMVAAVLLSGCGAEKFVKKGDQAQAIGEYFNAAALYRKAYMRTPVKEKSKRAERAFKAAECYRKINYTARAIGSYMNAVRYHYPDSTALFFLAQMQQKSGDYKKAAANFSLFLEKEPEHLLAQNGLKGCRLAQQWKEIPTDYSVKKEPVLNGRRTDFAPVLTGDEWEQLYISTTRPQTKGDDLSGITGIKNGDLYFSSNGHPGMGGLDLFCAKQDSTGSWKVENLKYPMNSPGDDFGMTFEGLHNRGFFSTNRNDARGWDHIMSFEKPDVVLSVKGWVYEKDGYELPDGLVYMVGNDGTNLKLSVRSDGSFVQEIKPHVKYIFLGTCKGFLNHKEELQVDTSKVSREYVLQFALASITAPVLVENVFYEFDRADLTPASTESLDRLVKLLNENPNVTIELSSHCDFRGNDRYNLNLSQRRAESVVRYLIEHGIAKDRLSPVGYGETQPKVVKKKLAETYPFLHEKDTLTEEFILKLPEEQQEICHALNRRTEFKVLRTTYGLFDEMGNLLKEALTGKKE